MKRPFLRTVALNLPVLGLLTLAGGAVGLSSSGCASSQPGASACEPPWEGQCVLRQVQKLAERSSPVPSVIYEAHYEPVGAPISVPVARVQIQTRAVFESAAKSHFEKYPEVACVQEVDAECFPGQLVAQVPAFTPPPVEVEKPLPEGCAAVESGAVSNQELETLSERVYFDEGGTQPLPDSQPALDAVLQQLRQDPSIQCMAVVGRSSRGESAGTDELRAAAIRRYLIRGGIEPGRVRALAISVSMDGSAAEIDPSDRHVLFRVLLRRP